MFLVKQGHHSVVCQLDLKGFSGELAVISSRASSVERLYSIMEQVGQKAEDWLPEFEKAST
jgi:type IV secretion system protein VirB4